MHNLINRFRNDPYQPIGGSDPSSLRASRSQNRLPASSRGDSLETSSYFDPVSIPSPLEQSPKNLPSISSLALPPLVPIEDDAIDTMKSLDKNIASYDSTLDSLNLSLDNFDTIKNAIETANLIASIESPKESTSFLKPEERKSTPSPVDNTMSSSQ